MKWVVLTVLISGCTLSPPIDTNEYLDEPCQLEGEWVLSHAPIGIGANCAPPTTLHIRLDEKGCDVDTLSGFSAPFEGQKPMTVSPRCRGSPSWCDASFTVSAAHFDASLGATERMELTLALRQMTDGRLGGTTTMSMTGCGGEADQVFTSFGEKAQ